MRGAYFIGFLLILLPLAVLGHDLYLAYFQEGEIDIAQPLKFSDLGWLWVQYGPETYDWAKTQIDAETWESRIDPVLRQNALLSAGIPAVLYLVILGILKVFGAGPFTDAGLIQRKGKFTFGDEKKKGPYKYKRK